LPRDDSTEDAGNAHAELACAEPIGALAVQLLEMATDAKGTSCVFVATNEHRAEALAGLMSALAPRLKVALFPAWDNLPYERVLPSRGAMGRRASVLLWLTDGTHRPDVILTTPPAVLRRVPPREAWKGARAEYRVGDRIDPSAIEARLAELGYVFDERVDAPGEAALRGRVIDIFPAAAPLPCRIEHAEGRIEAIYSYEPLTQRTEVPTELLLVDPASEFTLDERTLANASEGEAIDRQDGDKMLLHRHAGLETLFDYVAGARLVLDHDVADRVTDYFELVAEAYAARKELDQTSPVQPDRLYLRPEEWKCEIDKRLVAKVTPPSPDSFIPRFARERQAHRRFLEFVTVRLTGGGRVVLCGPTERERRRLAAAARSVKACIAHQESWQELSAAPGGSLQSIMLPIETGFHLRDENVTFIAAADLFGSAGIMEESHEQQVVLATPGDNVLQKGDVVVHLDHGMAILEGLQTVAAGTEPPVDTLLLRYADDVRLKVPVGDIGKVWRYGATKRGGLDRLHSDAWTKRRATLETEIAATADRMLASVQRRNESEAPVLVMPTRQGERFASRFPHNLTRDQARSIAAVAKDLASGRPMDRLVCGDVGFGKTEVALRAAATAVFSGKQVAVVAPTTVLVRQHVRTFQRRFAPFGLEVAQLSRLVKPAEARKVKAGLANGEVRIVIGTHALVGKGVKFADLGLMVIDEEQRFGARDKRKLRLYTGSLHVLTLTATPIPRTLQAAQIGLQDLSVIATPPVQRLPIRTVRASLDAALVREVLMREHRLLGQSFVVCPRIGDLELMAVKLARLVPELRVVVAHGEMPVAEMEKAMVDFANGDGDVLLATNIIESGLDVPRANTMLIWRADLFGLAQLHQLRGRVGRGARRGGVYLLTEADEKLPAAVERRLQSLVDLDRLGAGFTISARDLDMRGAGDLLGDDQAGHVKLVGLGLYQHLLSRALAAARGEAVDDWKPTVHLRVEGRIPEDYVPGEEMRIGLYAGLASLRTDEEISAFEDEVEDRFGPLPAPFKPLFLQAKLRVLCQRANVSTLDIGTKAIAVTPRAPFSAETIEDLATDNSGAVWSEDRFIVPCEGNVEEQADCALQLLYRMSS
jgi:transcription-repair coupling factor (superfamily II helicase)